MQMTETQNKIDEIVKAFDVLGIPLSIIDNSKTFMVKINLTNGVEHSGRGSVGGWDIKPIDVTVEDKLRCLEGCINFIKTRYLFDK
jgi:hypothetical protein